MAASQLLNVPLELLLNKPLVIYIKPDDRPTFWVELKRRQEQDCYRKWELQLEARNPNVKAVSCLMVALRDRKGQLVGFHWTLRDITERQRLEQMERKGDEASLDAETTELLSNWPLHTFSSGDLISLSSQTIWYVQKGLVKLTTLTDQNKEVMLGLMSPGHPFGSTLTALCRCMKQQHFQMYSSTASPLLKCLTRQCWLSICCGA